EIIKKAIQHKGYALVDIFQPCVSFNKINTYDWFKEHTYYLDSRYDVTNRIEAFKKSIEQNKLPLGIFYINKNKKTFEQNLKTYKQNNNPLYQRKIKKDKIVKLINLNK
ncbi:unnamed protein product, partial [marine sediment metagenome]